MRLITLLLLALLAGCQSTQQTKSSLSDQILSTQDPKLVTNRPDVYSFSNHRQVKATHIDLNLSISFRHRTLDGYVLIHYDRIDPDAKQIHLDIKDLKIKRAEANSNSKNPKLLWRTGQTIEGMGTELIVDLPADNSAIKLYYQTQPAASGLQWLKPSQTSGKKHPYLFSQSQSIHARSWIPMQDTPSVRVTYTANIEVSPGLRVVMSADNNDQEATEGQFQFDMPQPIPVYLLAIAAGDIHHKKISEHVTIYSEPQWLAAAAHEFAETEAMITATEALYGPYLWGQYDLLILPPSFPFGGMENPKLSFITPTVIAGDRSLDSLIAHELAHSWSGNLVTNDLWEDAWLNEGFTSYIESRIVEAVHGRPRMRMEATLAYQALLDELTVLPRPFQSLFAQAKTPDPDDYFSAVSYDKGRFFLEWMEQQVGRQAFDTFLNDYFRQFAFQSINTQQFINHLKSRLLALHPNKLTIDQVNQWLFEPGMPAFFTPPVTERFNAIDRWVNQWLLQQVKLTNIPTENWTTQEWLHFLRALPDQLSLSQLQQLDQAFNLTARQNSEVAHDWLLISVRNHYQPAYPRLIEYLVSIGRVKLIKPLYEALVADPELQNLASHIYHKARPGYHPIATAQLDALVPQENELSTD
ncbi:M1 family metallopeptidase [Marinicella sediminis]|uniref:Aminopeptidase N n=1 Tax=Marinicella sediminis TaxID=1792834 RepID=A0ABV7J8H6_9GAMM|nr:M1 family metallopeptidase [Marinicella sediminis]